MIPLEPDLLRAGQGRAKSHLAEGRCFFVTLSLRPLTMSWLSIPESDLIESLESARQRMNVQQRRLWDLIRIPPHKWQSSAHGDQGGGFWVIALLGQTVIWFNDIEEGFNNSRWTQFGQIDEYWCNQDQLEWTVQHLLDLMSIAQTEQT